jgi:hypothetical protein
MLTRTRRNHVVFRHPFGVKGVDQILPPGSYQIVTDEQLIEGLSFPVYRRVSTMIIVPARSARGSSIEMVPIAPHDLAAAQARDTIRQGTTSRDNPIRKSRTLQRSKVSSTRDL